MYNHFIVNKAHLKSRQWTGGHKLNDVDVDW